MEYEVVAPIARGGMGTVDLGRDGDGRSVALKRLTLHGTADEMRAARTRLHREAELLAQLDHPAIVPLVDVVDDDGEVVLVMPYVSGGTLAERVAKYGPLRRDEVLTLSQRLLGALAAAHRSGVVHRDVKPANVLFDEQGQALLADFGVATTRDGTPGLTAAGMVVGTPGFLSPEQARGEAATPSSDVFALGATLLFAATGEGPFGAGDPRVVLYRAAKDQVATVPRHLDPTLRRLLRSMLEPRPDRRPTAAALAAGPDGTLVLPRAPRRTGRRAAAIAGFVLAGVLAAVAGIAAANALDGDDGDQGAADTTSTTEATTTTAECDALPYQPCGAATPAPNTDGRNCVDDHADYDEIASNGCEAAPLGPDDSSELVDDVEANIVPEDDVDTFAAVVRDNRNLFCDGTIRFGLTAPSGTTLRLEIAEPDGDVIGEVISADGVADDIALVEPDCFGDDTTTLTLTVRPVGSDRSAEPYLLTRRGNY